MKIIATIKRSDGNESVGVMWQETAIFDSHATALEIMEWANSRVNQAYTESTRPELKTQVSLNVTLSLGQLEYLREVDK